MGIAASSLKKSRGFLKTVSVLAFATSFAANAQKRTQFFPSVQAPVERGHVGENGNIALGLFFSGISPLKNPYAAVDGTSATPFRYQVPSSFGFEATYAFMSWLEAGLSAEYTRFNASFVVKTPNNTRADSVSFRALPVTKGIVRGRLNVRDGFALESELGAGFGKGKITVSTSDQGTNAAATSSHVSSLVGHLAVGAAFIWDDGYSLHTSFGYGLHTLGNNRYTGVYDVLQDGNFSGPFAKILIRYNF